MTIPGGGPVQTMAPGSASGNNEAFIVNKDQGGVEILVILLGIVSVKFGSLLAIDSEEVGAGVVGLQWLEELPEGRVEANRRSDTPCRVQLSS